MALLAVALAGGEAGLGQDDGDTRLVRQTEALSPEEQKAKLKVREGFEIELFASEPMINKPINLAFDERGRLWVSSTVEYPYAAEKDRWDDEEGSRVRESRDAIKILEDTDGDGRADRCHDFVDGLNIPTGVLPWHRPGHAAGCIAWSIPNIWYFADTDGDDRCDLREVLFGPLGYEKDTHGMCSSFRLGADGWVYGTHGFNNTSHFAVREENLQGARPGGPGTELDLHSGNVYRFRPDGSRIEIWSWGQVNPFGLAFDRRGFLYSADCHSAPVYQLLRGAHYPSFGKPHGGLGFGPTMIEHQHGSTGICGIVFVDEGTWGKGTPDQVLIGNVVTSRINHDRIEWSGSTPRAIEEPDFLVSEDPWFRPVDLQLGPDGALYVADFYNRIIGHYEVPLDHPGRDRERGRIWRITKRGVEPPPKKAPIARLGPSASRPLEGLASESAFDRRIAASDLQANPRLESIPALVQALKECPDEDTHLAHALKLALKEQLSLPGAYGELSGTAAPDALPGITAVSLAVPSPEAAAFLLERLESGAIGPGQRKSAVQRIGRSGGTAEVDAFVEWMAAQGLLAQASGFSTLFEGRLEGEETALSPTLASWGLSLAERLIESWEESQPRSWTSRRHPDYPASRDPWGFQERTDSKGGSREVLSSLVVRGRDGETRTGILESPVFEAPASLRFWLCGHRGFPSEPAHDRNRVDLVDAETGAILETAFPPRSDVASEIHWALEFREGLPVRLRVTDGDAGTAYAWLAVGALSVPGDAVSIEDFRSVAQQERALADLAQNLAHVAPVGLRDRLARWLPSPPKIPEQEISSEQRRRLDQLIAQRSEVFDPKTADRGRGMVIYQAHCVACHQVGGEGGLVGPQLDGIGKRGVGRLAEDVLDPNRNVDAHFHLHRFTTTDGSVVGGFLQAETPQAVRYLDAAGQPGRLLKSRIRKTEVSPVSLMPSHFGELLEPAQFSDLRAFLLSL